jgi:sugar/nucleoside kinase (ribokinase family)
MAPSFTVVGDALVDVRVLPERPGRRGADVPAKIALGPGGQGANLAIRLARRSLSVSLACAIGTDDHGKLVRGWLMAEGIEVRAFDVPATGSVVVLVERDGERTMWSDRAPLGSSVRRVLSPADWVVVSGYLLTEPDAAIAARSLAVGAARRALIGCAVEDDGLDAWREAAAALAPDVIVLNQDEAARLGMADADGIVVTHREGAAGRVAGLDAEARVVPGAAAVDTTGAGDALAAVLIAGLAATWPPTKATFGAALGDAVEAASAVARLPGAQAPIAGELPVGIRA